MHSVCLLNCSFVCCREFEFSLISRDGAWLKLWCLMHTVCLLDCSFVCCREFQFSLISGGKLEAMAGTQRLQVNAVIATVRLAYGGQLIVDTTDLTAQAFKVCWPKMHAPHMRIRPHTGSHSGLYVPDPRARHMSSVRFTGKPNVSHPQAFV